MPSLPDGGGLHFILANPSLTAHPLGRGTAGHEYTLDPRKTWGVGAGRAWAAAVPCTEQEQRPRKVTQQQKLS